MQNLHTTIVDTIGLCYAIDILVLDHMLLYDIAYRHAYWRIRRLQCTATLHTHHVRYLRRGSLLHRAHLQERISAQDDLVGTGHLPGNLLSTVHIVGP